MAHEHRVAIRHMKPVTVSPVQTESLISEVVAWAVSFTLHRRHPIYNPADESRDIYTLSDVS